MVAIDIDADAVATVGIDCETERGHSAHARSSAGTGDITFLDQSIGDASDRGRGKSRQFGEFELSGFASHPYSLQHDALIVLARTRGIGSRRGPRARISSTFTHQIYRS
jgi:hypothetical protein